MAIPDEYTAVRKVGFNPPHIAYFLSRFGTFCTCLTTAIRAAPIDNCAALHYVEGIFAEIAIPATSLLFFFRVRAIYNRSRIITIFFGVLWLSIACLSVMIMLGITKEHIPYTRRCTDGLAHKYIIVPIILTAVNDTLIFLAISYRMMSLSAVDGPWTARAKSFFTGDGMYRLSKSLLHSGQVYYFVTIGVAITSTALIISPTIPGEMKAILISTYFTLASAMACLVFRAVLLGIIKDPQLNVATFRLPNIQHISSGDNGTTPSNYDKSGLSSLVINVAVERDTRADSYDGHALGKRQLMTDGVQRDDAYRV